MSDRTEKTPAERLAAASAWDVAWGVISCGGRQLLIRDGRWYADGAKGRVVPCEEKVVRVRVRAALYGIAFQQEGDRYPPPPPCRPGLLDEAFEELRRYLTPSNDPQAVAAIPSLLDALRADPSDDGSRSALADALGEVETSPVRYGHYPKWLLTAWPRAIPPRNTDPWYRRNAKHEIINSGNSVFDHCGSSALAGCRCFVTEPYLDRDQILELIRPIGLALGSAFVALPRGYWNPSVGRGVIFEPLVMPPPAPRRRRSGR